MVQGESLRSAVEVFLFHEARLLDEGRFEEWLALYTDETSYWIPYRRGAVDPSQEVSIVYDNRTHLTERVFRITGGTSFSQNPRSQTAHIVSNVMVTPLESGRLSVASMQLVVEYRRSLQSTFAADCRHELEVVDGDFKIASKRIDLVNADQPISDLTFLL